MLDYTYKVLGFQLAAMIGMLLGVPCDGGASGPVPARGPAGIAAGAADRDDVAAGESDLQGVVYLPGSLSLLPFVTVAWALGRSLEAPSEQAQGA